MSGTIIDISKLFYIICVMHIIYYNFSVLHPVNKTHARTKRIGLLSSELSEIPLREPNYYMIFSPIFSLGMCITPTHSY